LGGGMGLMLATPLVNASYRLHTQNCVCLRGGGEEQQQQHQHSMSGM
jgi:hypothetical protein